MMLLQSEVYYSLGACSRYTRSGTHAQARRLSCVCCGECITSSMQIVRCSGAMLCCTIPRHETAAYLSELERIIQASQIDLLLPMCEEVFYIAQGAEIASVLPCSCFSIGAAA